MLINAVVKALLSDCQLRLKAELFTLPDETLVFPGHLSDGRTVSTIVEERWRNRFFGGVPRESVIARFCTLSAIKS